LKCTAADTKFAETQQRKPYLVPPIEGLHLLHDGPRVVDRPLVFGWQVDEGRLDEAVLGEAKLDILQVPVIESHLLFLLWRQVLHPVKELQQATTSEHTVATVRL
jgi:hypothetical protein